MDIWDIENKFYWYSDLQRVQKSIAQYEIYKKIINIPGAFFELGVYKGCSFIRFATYRNMLENNFSRKFYGFDTFGKFPLDEIKSSEDEVFVEQFIKGGGDSIPVEELKNILDKKKIENYELLKGNIFNSLPNFLKNNKEIKIALLHLDMDTYEPTSFALSLLSERMVKGGVIVVDDYNSVFGATKALDEHCDKHDLKIKKFSYYNVPAYVDV